MPAKNTILSKEVAEKKLQRIALEIAGELFNEKENIIIIGITGSGMVVAEKIYALLKPMLQVPVQLISCKLDKKQPQEVNYSENVNFINKNILLVDDVTNSGRTLLYALKPLLQSHPKRIQTIALVERLHKSFPVKIDYIGLSVATTLQDHMQVEVKDGEIEGAYLI